MLQWRFSCRFKYVRGGPSAQGSQLWREIYCEGQMCGVRGGPAASYSSVVQLSPNPTHPPSGVVGGGGGQSSSPLPPFGRITTTFQLPSTTLSSIYLFPSLLPTASSERRRCATKGTRWRPGRGPPAHSCMHRDRYHRVTEDR
jgi:hypothetical protein